MVAGPRLAERRRAPRGARPRARRGGQAMRVLVTGGAGYIGSVLVEELLRDGHAVTVYDSLYKGHRGAVDPAATFVQGDLRDAAALRAALEQGQIEAAIH